LLKAPDEQVCSAALPGCPAVPSRRPPATFLSATATALPHAGGIPG